MKLNEHLSAEKKAWYRSRNWTRCSKCGGLKKATANTVCGCVSDADRMRRIKKRVGGLLCAIDYEGIRYIVGEKCVGRMRKL